MKNKTTSNFREHLIDSLKGDEEAQLIYLKASLEDNSDSPEAFLLSLKTIAESRGFSNLATDAGLSRESLYRTLSESGNPKLDTIFKLMNALGFRLSVESKEIR